MDAFDYFLLVFVIVDVAKEFDHSKTHVAVATTLTLAARPVGAALFGYWADKVGRRTPLLVCVLFYSTVGFLTAFSPSLTALLVLRCLYGIGMGGEWGLGASLAMEKSPAEKRGLFSACCSRAIPSATSSLRSPSSSSSRRSAGGACSSPPPCPPCSRSSSACASASPRPGRRPRRARARRASVSARSSCSRGSCAASSTWR